MTVIIEKNPRRSEFIRLLDSQKEYFKHYFREEETLDFIFDRFAEIMFNLDTIDRESSFKNRSTSRKISDQLRKSKNKAFRTIMFHRGSLL